MFIFGAVGSGALMFAYLAAIESGRYPLIFLAAVLMSGVVYSAMNGIQPSLYGEMFPTRVRLSGMAIGTQIGFAIGGFAPTAAAAIAGDGPDGWVPVAAYVLVSSLIAAIAVATARETVQAAAARDRRAHGALRAPRRPRRASRPGRASRNRRRLRCGGGRDAPPPGACATPTAPSGRSSTSPRASSPTKASRARAWTRSPPRRAPRSG